MRGAGVSLFPPFSSLVHLLPHLLLFFTFFVYFTYFLLLSIYTFSASGATGRALDLRLTGRDFNS